MLFPNSIYVFEDLVSRRRAKKRRKRNARTPWRRIHRRMSEVALTVMWIRGTHLENAPDADML
jgi:hypothetical protein